MDSQDGLSHAGDVPELDATHAVALYDPDDGTIHHMHYVLVLRGAKESDADEREREAFEVAQRLGREVSKLHALHAPDIGRTDTLYRVDLERPALVELPPPTDLRRGR